MMPNYTTIITPIVPTQVHALRQYLRDHAEPRAGDDASPVQCQPLFRFDRISSLHFCSFVVLEEAKGDPCLVFEATFDGPRADFLQELWRIAPEGMHAVYKNCLGYPQSGLDVPELIQDYLIRHDAGAHTFFSGCPGRSVAQIQGESQLRADLVTFLSGRSGTTGASPATLAGLQQTIQRDFIRGRGENRWAEQPAVVPWAVARRHWVAWAAIGAILAGACVLGAVAVLLFFGKGPAALSNCIDHVFTRTWKIGSDLTQPGLSGWPWLGRLITELQLPILPLVLVLAGFWILIRVVELVFTALTEDPRRHVFVLRFPLHIMVILRYALPIFLVGFVALGIVGNGPLAAPERSVHPSQVKTFIEKLDRKLMPEDSPVHQEKPSRSVSFLMLLVLGLVWFGLHYWATSLKLAVQFQMLSPMAESWRLFLLDGLRFAMMIAAVVAVLVVARHFPPGALESARAFASVATLVVLVVAAYAVVGILAGYAAAFVLLMIVRTLERSDRRKFKRAADLVARPTSTHAQAREEGGINRYQNHLASLTQVKPGFLRRWFLRGSLFLINLLSRFWFNRGELGGIPTIFSARWVLIDHGRRLLFLDNYGGAWNSYLNEFIDMGAVKGLNAIWSNTYVKAADGTKYAYPESRYYFWKGAQDERPFKAYVRQSQLETIVWYSAYSTLSITNINANSDLRQVLFKELSPCELDSIVHRL
jgi:hypothetical protein